MAKKLVILITGQKTRLELSSKIKNMIAPLCENQRYDVSVVLSLSETQNFTNKDKYHSKFKYDLCNIEKELDTIPYYMNNIKYPELNINQQLCSQLDHQGKGLLYIQQRSKNHVRQFYTLSNSWSIIKELNPDILIRLREDVYLPTSFKLSKYYKVLRTISSRTHSKKLICTPDDNSWGGINDRLAFVSKKAIPVYLTKPFEVYKSYNNNYNRKFNNPEQFLKAVYINNGVSLLTSNIYLKVLGQ